LIPAADLAPHDIAFLLAEVDRLTVSNENHAAVSAEWRTKYQALADKERESAGRVLELEAQLSAPHPFLAVLSVRCQSHPIYGEERSDLTPNLCAVCGYWTKL